MTHQTPRQFFELARDKTASKSYRNLARKIEVSNGALTDWRTGRSTPSDETMMRVAIRANIDPKEALLLLNLWRSHGEVKAAYEVLLNRTVKKFGVTSALVFCFSLAHLGETSQASEIATNSYSFSAKAPYHNAESNKHYPITRRIYHALGKLRYRLFSFFVHRRPLHAFQAFQMGV